MKIYFLYENIFFSNSLKMDILNVKKMYSFLNSYFKYIGTLATILYIAHIKNYTLKMLIVTKKKLVI